MHIKLTHRQKELVDLMLNSYKPLSYVNDKGRECFLDVSNRDYCLYNTITLRALKRKGLIETDGELKTVKLESRLGYNKRIVYLQCKEYYLIDGARNDSTL